MIDIDFKFYRSILWRRLPLILFIWVLITGVGVSVAYLLPPMYRSEARILVEKPQIPGSLVTQTVTVTSQEIIQSIQQRMQTRANMLGIAERFNIFANQPDLSPSERVEAMRRNTSFRVINLGDKRSRAPSATMFTVSFTNEKPRLAARVTNEFVTLIQEQNVKLRTDRATNTAEFFEQEVARLSNELGDMEGQIVAFENENSDSLPSSLQFRMSEMSRIQTRLMQIATQELTLLDQKAQLERVIADPSLAPAVPTAQQSPEQRQLVQLNTQLAQARAVYSETHNKVLQIKAQIDALEATISGRAADDSANAGPSVPSQIQTNLDQVNTNLDFLARQRTDLETELARLKATVDATPNVGMGLNVLNRKYAALQNQYDAAVNRLNAAATGESIEVRQQGERFEVIEQASIPEEPESPPRLLIAGGSVLGGLALGMALVLVLELLNKSIRRPRELVSTLGIQAFGTVPYIATQSEIIRSRLKTALVLLVIGIGVPAALYAIHYQYMPIDLILSKVIERFGLDDLTRSFS